MSNPVVTFSYPGWIAQYPEFGFVTAPQAQGYFNQACLLVDNTTTSPVQDQTQLATLLNMATAHIASLFAPQNGQAPRGLVGRINSATEGSVSVQAEYIAPKTDSQAYWNQTPYGAQYWVATLQYRTGFFVPPLCGANRRGLPGFPFGVFPRF